MLPSVACDCDTFTHVHFKTIPINTAVTTSNTTATTTLIASALVSRRRRLLNDFCIVPSVVLTKMGVNIDVESETNRNIRAIRNDFALTCDCLNVHTMSTIKNLVSMHKSS